MAEDAEVSGSALGFEKNRRIDFIAREAIRFVQRQIFIETDPAEYAELLIDLLSLCAQFEDVLGDFVKGVRASVLPPEHRSLFNLPMISESEVDKMMADLPSFADELAM